MSDPLPSPIGSLPLSASNAEHSRPRGLSGRLAFPRSVSDTTHDIQLVQRQLTEAAVGPPPDQRAVTKEEYASGLQIMKEAQTACRDANEYKAASEELNRELSIAQNLTRNTEDELAKVKDENHKMRSEYDDLQKKFTATDIACTKSLSQFSKLKREVEDIKSERDALYSEMDYLLDEIDVLKTNLTIQETNVDTLKRLSERLQEDIAKYKKRQEETAEKHRIAVLRMETELAKDVDELKKEYEAKEGELRGLLNKSESIRQQADQEWSSREARLERSATEEVKAKNKELQKLRLQIEQLLREQIDSMRDRVKDKSSNEATTVPGRPSGGGARSSRKAPLDLYEHTADVMAEVSAGKSILSLEVLAKGDEFRSPVYWHGGTPTHIADLGSMDVGVRLSVDSSVLHAQPQQNSQSVVPYRSTLRLNQEQQWAFKTENNVEVVVGLRILPPRTR